MQENTIKNDCQLRLSETFLQLTVIFEKTCNFFNIFIKKIDSWP